MCPRNRDRSLKCGTPRSPKPIVSAVSTPPPCPPSAASTSDLPPLSCPAPTISTPRSRRHRAQKLSRKDQRARAPRSCPSPSLHAQRGSTREPRASDSRSRLFSPQLQNLLRLNSTLVPIFCLLHSPPPTPLTSSPHPYPLVRPSTCLPLSPRTCKGSRITKRRKQGGRRNASGDGERRRFSNLSSVPD